MSFALSRLERLYAQIESTYGTIPNAGGTASLAGTDALRFIKASMGNQAAMIERPDKTGTRSRMAGILGRKYANWSAEMSIAPNGVAGTKPDMDVFMQLICGKAGAATAGTKTITAATNATPIVCTSTAHGWANGDVIFISGATGLTAMNGVWVIGSVATDTFTLVGSAGNGVFGGTVTASRVGYRYDLDDAIVSASLWSFRQPSTIDQRVVSGAVAQEATFQLGADVAQASFNGEGLWMLGKNQFGVADVTQKSGLTAFPNEPATPVTNGGIIAGFTGKIAVNGYTLSTIRTATVRVQTGNAIVKDTFGNYYGSSGEGDVRNVSIQFSIYEDDSTGYANLIQCAHDKTVVQIPMFLGTVNGSIFGCVMNGVQLVPPTTEEQRRFIANFPEATAHGSSLTARDEAYFVFI